MLFNAADTALVMFDLDGTLIDTVPDIAHALDEAMLAMGFVAPGLAAARSWVGNGSLVLIERALTAALGCPPAKKVLKRTQQHFFRFYENCCNQHSQLYPGVSDALAFLAEQRISLACVTNKPARFTPKVLQGCGIAEYFSLLVSGDSLPQRKPYPAQLEFAMAEFGVDAASCLMVGDSRNDILAARAAAVPVLCVDYGYNHDEPIYADGRSADENPDHVVSDLMAFFAPFSAA